ncbi:MAG: HAD-IA family hydrolase [Candidatus Omnitrophica bacterium]|nr:HAD-IA family hydrolase [Candidatus Omnitrophota bacterium]
MRIKAVFFDFDGLIVDTETHEYQAWSRIFKGHGAELPLEDWSICIGTMDHNFDPVGFLSNVTQSELDRIALTEEHREEYHRGAFTAPLMEGISERLAEADELGLKKAVVSSSTYDWVGRHLAIRQLQERFDLIQTSEEVTRTKPDPQLYLLALEKLNLAPDEAIVLEDSAHGIDAAKAAGLYAVAVPNSVTSHLPFSNADRVLGSLSEISLREFL